MDTALAVRAAVVSAALLALGAFDVATGSTTPDWLLAGAGALPVALLGLFLVLEPKPNQTLG